MTDKIIRIATRKSPLALWQAKYVQQQLMAAHPGLQVELITLVTKGDVLLDSPLSKIGGKGLFVKELEQAMLDGYADLAVHSIKDIPVTFPRGLGLVTICPRENPLDAFVSNHYASVEDLPQGAVVGTSSLRRQCQLSAHRPDLQIRALRGNVGTRLSKLDAGDYDAIILASAGLIRLDLASRIRTHLPAEFSLPAVGQGAVGIECRLADQALIDLLAPLNHPDTETCVRAERAMNTRLGGGCQVPIASYAILENNQLWLRGLVGTPEGDVIITGERHGHRNQCQEMGISLADELLSRGARDILRTIYQDKTPL